MNNTVHLLERRLGGCAENNLVRIIRNTKLVQKVRTDRKKLLISWSYQHALLQLILEKRKPKLIKIKVKCTLLQALRLCTGRTARRGSRGIDLPFHDHGTRRG